MLSTARLSMLATVFFLISCGGGDGGGDTPPTPAPTPTPTGTAIIGLTDAPGDFLSYQVDVTSIRLTAANGAVVETLSESTTVDFAQYVEVTELVTAATIPAGTYTSATLVLDYSNAQVWVEDTDGAAVSATVLDAAGAALTRAEVTVQFNDRDRFVIAAGAPAHITLDFDLEASHKVNLFTPPVTVSFDGMLTADTLLEDPKTRRARGLLRTVDVAASSFTLGVRPFFHPRGDFGPLTLGIEATTEFEIDQTSYTGDAGLTALDALDPGAPVVALALFDRDSGRIIASEVLAGSSVPWGAADIATGSVIARNGDLLTLRGVTLVDDAMQVTFNDTLDIRLASTTAIRQQGGNLISLSAADISVGQALTAIGELDADGVLNTDDGLVRVLYSTLSGVATSVAPVTVDVTRLNGRRPALFDFSGTGVDASTDADADAYELHTGALSLDGLQIGEPLRARGLIAAFGTAPADFLTQSLGDLSAVPGRLRLVWSAPGVTDALIVANDGALTLALDADTLTPVHGLTQAGIRRDLLDLGDTVTLTPSTSGNGVFALRLDSNTMMYFDFASFASAVAQALDGSTALISVRGNVVPAGVNTYVARRLQVHIQ